MKLRDLMIPDPTFDDRGRTKIEKRNHYGSHACYLKSWAWLPYYCVLLIVTADIIVSLINNNILLANVIKY